MKSIVLLPLNLSLLGCHATLLLSESLRYDARNVWRYEIFPPN